MRRGPRNAMFVLILIVFGAAVTSAIIRRNDVNERKTLAGPGVTTSTPATTRATPTTNGTGGVGIPPTSVEDGGPNATTTTSPLLPTTSAGGTATTRATLPPTSAGAGPATTSQPPGTVAAHPTTGGPDTFAAGLALLVASAGILVLLRRRAVGGDRPGRPA